MPYRPNADKGALLLTSVLPAHITITVGNDAALSTSECVYYTNQHQEEASLLDDLAQLWLNFDPFESLLCCSVA